MQKNDKSYTFLLAHSSKSGIYIKRVALRKSYMHFGTVGILLALGIPALSIGMSGIASTHKAAWAGRSLQFTGPSVAREGRRSSDRRSRAGRVRPWMTRPGHD